MRGGLSIFPGYAALHPGYLLANPTYELAPRFAWPGYKEPLGKTPSGQPNF
jgi:hypothetical protein